MVAAVSWQYSVGAGVKLESLFHHSTFTSTIARGNFPVANPFQPDQMLTYRLTYHLLGAFVTRLADQPAPEVLTWLTAALYILVFFGAVGIGLAARFGPRRTLLAAALFLTVGGFGWLQLAQLASPDFADYNHHTLVASYLRGAVGPAMANVWNVSLSYGYLVLFCGLTLYIYAWRAEGWRRTALALATGVVLGHLAAASESWFVALAAALLVDLVLRLVASRRVTYRNILRVAGAAAALVAAALSSPGILFASLLNGATIHSGLRFKGGNILRYKLSELNTESDGPGAEIWLPLMQADLVWLWGLLLVAAPLALLYVWKTKHHVSWLLLLYSGACFGAFLLFTVDHAVDMWRFVYSGVAALGFVTGLAVIWLLSALRAANPPVRHAALLVSLGAGALYVGGYAQYSLAIPWFADPRPPEAYREDVAAVETFLNRETDVRERLLVLGNAPHWHYPQLSHSQGERATFAMYTAAYSGQYSPTGALFSNRLALPIDSPQLRRAIAAQGKLSAVDLQELEVTYLYASEPWLTGLHRAVLAEKLARGSLARVWREQDSDPPQACRAFLRLDETARNSVAAVTFEEGGRVALPRAPLQLELPLLRTVTADGKSTSTERGKVQATVLITVSEPSTVVVESSDGFSMGLAVEDALSLRTLALAAGSVLTVRITSGSAQVLWIEAYAPIAPHAAAFVAEDLELCGETG